MAEPKIKEIQKRDGKLAPFSLEKITRAIFKATEAVGEPNFDLAKQLGDKVVEAMNEKLMNDATPKVEQIQDIVEQVLVEEGQAKVAKHYILYRQKRSEVRQQKQQALQKEEIDEVDKRFDLNALRVLCSRYLRKDDQGDIIETPKELFERVAVHTALTSLFFDEDLYQPKSEIVHPTENLEFKDFENKLRIGRFVLNQFHFEGLKLLFNRFNKEGQVQCKLSGILQMFERGHFNKYEAEVEKYFALMANRKFFPNTPALANFGSYLGMGSACFVLGIEDSIESIMEALFRAAIIFKSGGGVGYNFSKLRPVGDFIKSTGGVSSGPISFMSLFDKMSDVIKQGGIRRGASMGILDINHPDIEEFIVAKRGNQALRNFNISVLMKPDFWQAYEKKEPYALLNPKNGTVVKQVDPQNLFNMIVYQAWESAEPGVLFEDAINKYNPFLEHLGPIQSTNPCGELPLYKDESCNLGSINVWAFCKANPTNGRKKAVEFDWDGLKETVGVAVKFLDNVIDVNKYPLLEIEEMTLKTRKIGLGIMGLGDLLFELEIPYNSPDGLEFMEKLMEFVNYHSKVASIELAKQRGKFPYYAKSFYSDGKLPMAGPYSQGGKHHLDWEGLKEQIKQYGLRHSQTTTNAPTGSISMIAGCSSGIEPVFSLVFEKEVAIGSFYYVDSVFEKGMEREGLFDDALIKVLATPQWKI
ncbi:MAG: adenosylcobalamin-dependent ribonucleoside-diphosphate reductase [Candidatus Gribaldobacteria bacterium]|nr:adenosylcobalamin-dependent ribonucleoside-diphosphate reductase [Candidatus Gribaldobacteria bacterium]